MLRQDGSVRSANLPGKRTLATENVEVDNGTYRCMVVEIYYTDDSRNLTFNNKQVTYDCIILGGRKEGQIIANCKLVNYLGGEYNYHERVLRKAESPFNGPGAVEPARQKGDIVYVQFVGKTSNPIIIGLGTHVLDEDSTGATKSDGPIWREQYNGVFKEINKLGEYQLQIKGGTFNNDAGYLRPNEEFLTKLGIVKEVFTREYKSGMKITEDGANDRVTFQLASGTLIDVDGAGGVITIDADGGTNQVVINKSGEITIKASSKVNVTAPLVDVGENAVFSSTLFENLLTEFSKHTHLSTSILTPAVSSPPLAPLISLVGSQSVKVKE